MPDIAAPVAAPAPVAEGTNSANSANPVDPVLPGTSAKAPGDTTKPAGDGKEVVRFKANGQMVEFTKEELIRRASKDYAGDQKLASAASESKKIKAMLQALNSDEGLFEVAKALGKDPEAMLEAHLKRRAEMAQMTPEQREVAELRAEKARLEAEREQDRQASETSKRQVMEKEAWTRVEAEAMSVLDKVDLGGMGKAEGLFLLADAAEANLAYGLDLTPEELIAEVQSRVDRSKNELATRMRKGLTDDALLNHLGNDVVQEVLRAAIKRLKGGQSLVPMKQSEKTETSQSEEQLSAKALATAALSSEFF
jgi:hypothetical protein